MNKKVAKALADAEVVKFGEFTLANGNKSPVYVDLRVLPSYPESLHTIGDELAKLTKKLDIDIVAGAETAGIPIATVISLKTMIPMIYVRKKPKNYGTMEMVEGRLEHGQKVALIDDMATNAFSKTKFIEGIRHGGGIVEHCIIILDRGQGATEALLKENVKLHSLITLRELLSYLKDDKKVDADSYSRTLTYLDET